MRKSLALPLCLLGLVLAGCSGLSGAERPTPLPTAVPPKYTPGVWGIGFEYEFPTGFWEEGPHQYAYRIDCPDLFGEDSTSSWQPFTVTQDVGLMPLAAYMRSYGLSRDAWKPIDWAGPYIHPRQFTIAVVYIVGVPEEVAERAAEECQAHVLWDEHFSQTLAPMEPFLP